MSHHRRFAATITVVLVAALTQTVLGTLAGPAAADGHGTIGGGVVVGGNDNDSTPDGPAGGGTGDGTTGGGDGDGGGGNLSTGYFSGSKFWYGDLTSPPVKKCYGGTPCDDSAEGVVEYYSGKCAPPKGNKWGRWEGVEAYWAGNYGTTEETGSGSQETYTEAWYDCISAAAWNDVPLTCAKNFDVHLVGPMLNPDKPKKVMLDYQTPKSDFFSTGKKDPALCDDSLQVMVNKKLPHYGRYLLTITPFVSECSLRTYYKVDTRTQTVPDPEVVNCDPPHADGKHEFRAQMFCQDPGWRPDWSGNYSYTPEDCLKEDGGVWDCGPQVDKTPTLDGRDGDPVAVLDDATTRRMRWKTPQPQGDLREIEDREARLRFVGGSPYRTTAPPQGDTQPFVTSPSLNQWSAGWKGDGGTDEKTQWKAAFMAAGTPGHPWTAKPTWKFSAEFLIEQVTIEAFDLGTGEFTTSTSSDWQRMPAACTGQPIQVDVHRARNSSH